MGAVIEDRRATAFFMLGPDTIVDDRVRLLAIAKDSRAQAVAPTLETIAEGTYPITDRLTFYVHPKAPRVAREFVKFATGPEGARIVREYGLWPECELEAQRQKVRLRDMEAGKGMALTVRGIAGAERVMGAAAVDFTRAKATAQLHYQLATPGPVEDVFREGATLFVSDRPLSRAKSAGSTSAPSNTGHAESEGVADHVESEPSADRVESKRLGDRAVAIVVRPSNGVERLTVAELRDIFSGKIVNWPDETKRIELFGLPKNGDLTRLFEEKIGGPAREARVQRPGDSGKVIEAVAKSPTGIGFVDVAQISPTEDRVKVVGLVAVDQKRPLKPSRERVPKGYPLAQPLMVYLSPDADETAKDFFDFLATGGGHETILNHGFVPSPASPPRTRKKASAPTASLVSITASEGKVNPPGAATGRSSDSRADGTPDAAVLAIKPGRGKQTSNPNERKADSSSTSSGPGEAAKNALAESSADPNDAMPENRPETPPSDKTSPPLLTDGEWPVVMGVGGVLLLLIVGIAVISTRKPRRSSHEKPRGRG